TFAERNADDAHAYRNRDGVERELGVAVWRNPHTLDQMKRLLDRERLRLVVVRKLRQPFVHKLDATAVEKSPVALGRHEHRPAAVVRYPDDRAVSRQVMSSQNRFQFELSCHCALIGLLGPSERLS